MRFAIITIRSFDGFCLKLSPAQVSIRGKPFPGVKVGFCCRRLMKQHYFVVVLAHSLHGRLRRIHIPQKALYVVVGLALFGGFSLFGMVSSYLRMTWKVSNYNSLRSEVDTLRNRYQALQREND